MMDLKKQMKSAGDAIRRKSGNFRPSIGLILGSGLGILADELENPIIVPYSEIPNMKESGVEGHDGALYMGRLEGRDVMIFKGRIHYYEGHTMKEITFPVRIMQELGVPVMILTNASGGVRDDLVPGDLMIIKDHINLMGDNPLMGRNDPELGPRFPDMSNVYDKDLVKLAVHACQKIGIEAKTGVYCAVTGPNYETYAETRYMKLIGSDVIGMSTVPEAIVGAHAGIKTLGISCVTDVIHAQAVEVSHEEVLEVANRIKPTFIKLVREILAEINL